MFAFPEIIQHLLVGFAQILNSGTQPNLYPLAGMDDYINKGGSAKFRKVNLICLNASEIAVFVTPTGFYSYSVMPLPTSEKTK